MKPTPIKTRKILEKLISPAMPLKPIDVVKMRITGPTRTRELLIKRAFSMLLNFSIKSAAVISRLPEKIRNSAIEKTIFSIELNMVPPYCK